MAEGRREHLCLRLPKLLLLVLDLLHEAVDLLVQVLQTDRNCWAAQVELLSHGDAEVVIIIE